ncbi:MAG: NAD-dependent epimerase/dehydratase family protein [Candidatus Bruticola sp.]
MRVLVAGGAGFIGANLCRALLKRGEAVTVIDNFCTGQAENLEGLNLEIIKADLCTVSDLPGHFDAVINLACPASPPAYQAIPLETLWVGAAGVRNALEIARRCGARFLQASTSEVYGEPLVHPQPETYRGNVSCTGPRSMYDESKRFSEALITAYRNKYGLSTAIARIFNTYGPYMRSDDGRVVTNFLSQIIGGQPLTIYGDGTQTRSFCFVSDTVEGLIRLLLSEESGPMNIGNPEEHTMIELAETIGQVCGCQAKLVYKELPGDDPTRRCPDISLAKQRLGWSPCVSLTDGLTQTYRWIQQKLKEQPR